MLVVDRRKARIVVQAFNGVTAARQLEIGVTCGARFVRQEARRREPAVVCQQPSVVRSPQFGDRRRSRPRGRRDYRNRGKPLVSVDAA